MSDVKYYNTVETAKIIRSELKAKFPKVKFSVRSDKYAGGSSVRVEWTDGYSDNEVVDFIRQFEGAKFDGMTDMKSYKMAAIYKGELVKWGADYVSVRRNISAELLTKVANSVAYEFGKPEPEIIRYELVDGMIGRAYIKTDYTVMIGNEYLSVYVNRQMADINAFDFDELIANQNVVSDEDEVKVEIEQDEIADLHEDLQEKQQESSDVKLETIVPLDAIDDYRFFVTGKFAFLNKSNTLDEYKKECLSPSGYSNELSKVEEVVTLWTEDYDKFMNNLLRDVEWLKGKGGLGTITPPEREVEEWYQYTKQEQEQWREGCYRKCILVVAEGREAILVDPQGYSYARYVGLIADQILVKDRLSIINIF